jgi:hypothetical protein
MVQNLGKLPDDETRRYPQILWKIELFLSGIILKTRGWEVVYFLGKK